MAIINNPPSPAAQPAAKRSSGLFWFGVPRLRGPPEGGTPNVLRSSPLPEAEHLAFRFVGRAVARIRACLRNVAAAILAAVEGGILPPGNEVDSGRWLENCDVTWLAHEFPAGLPPSRRLVSSKRCEDGRGAMAGGGKPGSTAGTDACRYILQAAKCLFSFNRIRQALRACP